MALLSPGLANEFVVRGLLTELQLSEVSQFQEAFGESFRQAVQKLGLAREQDVLDVYSELLNLRQLKSAKAKSPGLEDIQAALEAFGLDPSWCHTLDLILWFDSEDPSTLNYAMRDPLSLQGEEALESIWEGHKQQYIVTNRLLDALFAQLKAEETRISSVQSLGEIEKLRELAEEAPVIEFVNSLLSDALEANASDVHVEPSEDAFETRLRVDGVLSYRKNHPRALFDSVVTRIKILSGMDISERRLPQDGRQTVRVAGEDVDLRVSSIPSSYGESVVLRLLRKQSSLPSISGLGVSPDVLKQLEDLIRLPNGVFLVTGPTGSGKSTTLYRVLELLNNGSKKIITIEDPVEYEMSDIGQVQVHSDIGLTFANGLRAMLRHDPDIIMVGEIRDAETAEVAIQAALTGHMVFSTLHTNSAAGAIERLQDLGVEPFLIKASLRGVLGQRLLRRVCENCSPSAPEPKQPGETIGRPEALATYAPEPIGCQMCNQSGYKGRLGVFELLNVNHITEKFGHLPLTEMFQPETLRSIKYKTMVDDALVKCQKGLTTIKEIERVFGRIGNGD